MRGRKRNQLATHAILLFAAFLTFLPFFAVVDNSLRTNNEIYASFFGVPRALRNLARLATGRPIEGENGAVKKADPPSTPRSSSGRTASTGNDDPATMGYQWGELTRGYRYGWSVLRGYTLNTIFVAAATVFGVILFGSLSGYVFSRYRFPGRRLLFMVILSILMIPGILTLVPSFLLVKKLGLLNSYWVLILPYVAGGQIVAIFLFKSFFDGLPEDLFEAARMDGAGHLGLYWNIVIPLSKPVVSVVAIINILGVWNNFLWPFITNSDNRYHVIASGIYLIGKTDIATNLGAMNAALVLSGVPLLILFIYATRPFMKGVTSGAFKA